MRSRSRIVLSGLMLMLILGTSQVAKAGTGFPFMCAAIGLRASVLPVAAAVANPNFFPCATDTAEAFFAPVPGAGGVYALVAQTGLNNNLDARASVGQLTLVLGGTVIEAGVIRSVATNKNCHPQGFTKIAKLDINFKPVVDLNVPPNTAIALPGVPLTITLNRQITTITPLGAIFSVAAIEIATTDPVNPESIVVAESIVGCIGVG